MLQKTVFTLQYFKCPEYFYSYFSSKSAGIMKKKDNE